MKISGIRATPVNIPMELPFIWSVGSYPGTSRTIVEVLTDEGLVGLGEAPSAASARVLTELLAPRLQGADAFDIEACERLAVPETKIDPNTDDASTLRAFGGVEMALWDLRGKALGLPLYRLLGGAVRKEIPFTEYYGYRRGTPGLKGECTPGEVVSYCARMREEHGSTMFEGKCPVDIGQAVALVGELRSALGWDAILRLDANMAFSVDAGRRLLARLEPYGLDNFEDPVAAFWDMARLRQHSAIPFSSHVPDLRLAVRLGCPDAIVLNLTALGGIWRTVRFVAACEAMGVDFWFYSGDAGVSTAAYLHVAAAMQHIHLPSQSLLRWQTDDVIAEGPFRPEHNVVRVPEEPGLGVHLSPAGLQRCFERFRDQGAYDHYSCADHTHPYARVPVV